MKKLIILSSFLVFGTIAFAQTASKSTQSNNANSLITSEQIKAEPAAAVSVSQTKSTDKKECSSEEKKACGTKAGKKSCCSSKAEAKKEETK